MFTRIKTQLIRSRKSRADLLHKARQRRRAALQKYRQDIEDTANIFT